MITFVDVIELDVKPLQRISDLRFDLLRHGRNRIEEIVVNLGPCVDNRIICNLVEVHFSAVGIYGDLHRIFRVVDDAFRECLDGTFVGLVPQDFTEGVRILLACCEPVDHPQDLFIGDKRIGIAVEEQKGSNTARPYHRCASDVHARFFIVDVA